MSPGKKTVDQMPRPIEDRMLARALNELARTVNIIAVYGNEHPSVELTVQETGNLFTHLFRRRNAVKLGCINGALTVDDTPVQATAVLTKSLERRLAMLKITALRISPGISEAEILQLAGILSHKEAANFLIALKSSSFPHIKIESLLPDPAENSTGENTECNVAGIANNGTLILNGQEPDGRVSAQMLNVDSERILAYLNDDFSQPPEEVGKDLASLSSSPGKLSALILAAVNARYSAVPNPGESLGELVVGCLRRTYEALHDQPGFQTSEGKAELRKTLLRIEEDMLEKIRVLTGGTDAETIRQIVQNIREIDECLGFEIAALEYVQNQRNMEKNRKQLRFFIESHGDSFAEGLLLNSEFPQTDWNRIVMESEKHNADVDSQDIAEGLNTLAKVFEKLENLLKSEDSDSAKLNMLLGRANKNLDDTIFTTKVKLDSLSQQLGDTGTIGGQGREMDRKELLSSISEIAQELMQPLTAINATIEMLLHGFAGEVNEEQRNMLELAQSSGEHLTYLMKNLIAIVGCPENKGIDERYHTTSEEVAMMQDIEGQEHLPLNYFIE